MCAESLYCTGCGIQILAYLDLGAVIEVTVTRPHLVGVPAVGSSSTYAVEHLCRNCADEDEVDIMIDDGGGC